MTERIKTGRKTINKRLKSFYLQNLNNMIIYKWNIFVQNDKIFQQNTRFKEKKQWKHLSWTSWSSYGQSSV